MNSQELSTSIPGAEVAPPSSDRALKKQSKFSGFRILKQISNGKCPIYMVSCADGDSMYALKIFYHEDDHPTIFFRNEARLAKLSHRNIIFPIYFEESRTCIINKKQQKISFTLMEYAPNKDFFDALMEIKVKFDDMMVRTYFHQLMDGVEYLHSHGIAHLDLKLENLMLGENFELKIIDFDLSYVRGDNSILTRGTKYFRAPELAQDKMKNLKAVDVYSMGIILFVLKSRKFLPHHEDELFDGVDFFKLLEENSKQFWKKHCEIHSKDSDFWDKDFKSLFQGMTKQNPDERFSIDQVKESAWFKGPTYKQDKISKIMKKYYERYKNKFLEN